MKWVDRAGKVLETLGEPTQAIDMFRLSPDQQHVAVQYHSGGLSDLWLLDTQRGVPSRLTSDTRFSTQPVWSSDGRTILFVHLEQSNLLRIPASGIGGAQVVVRRPTPSSLPLDWSRDGRWLLTRERGSETGDDAYDNREQRQPKETEAQGSPKLHASSTRSGCVQSCRMEPKSQVASSAGFSPNRVFPGQVTKSPQTSGTFSP